MDMNLAVLLAMIALMLGGALLLNFQIKHQAKKEQAQAESKKAPVATGATAPAK